SAPDQYSFRPRCRQKPVPWPQAPERSPMARAARRTSSAGVMYARLYLRPGAPGILRNRLVPRFTVLGFELAEGVVRVCGADATGGLGDLAVLQEIGVSYRNTVVGRDQAVAGVRKRGLCGRLAGQRVDDRRSGHLGLCVRREAGLWH